MGAKLIQAFIWPPTMLVLIKKHQHKGWNWVISGVNGITVTPHFKLPPDPGACPMFVPSYARDRENSPMQSMGQINTPSQTFPRNTKPARHPWWSLGSVQKSQSITAYQPFDEKLSLTRPQGILQPIQHGAIPLFSKGWHLKKIWTTQGTGTKWKVLSAPT